MIYRSKVAGAYFECLVCGAVEFHDLWFWRIIHRLAHREKY